MRALAPPCVPVPTPDEETRPRFPAAVLVLVPWTLVGDQVTLVVEADWDGEAHPAGDGVRFDPIRSGRVAWILGAHAWAGAWRVPSTLCCTPSNSEQERAG
jgi:hypothetical protein